jgi:phosphoglycerate-specific signal transduction histidine kinase
MKLINNNKYYIIDVEYIINEFIPFLNYDMNNNFNLKIWNFKNNNENKKVINSLNSKMSQDILIKHKLEYIIHSINELNYFMSINSNNINHDLFNRLKTIFNIFSKNSNRFINNSKKVSDYRNIVAIIKQVYYLFKQIIEINDIFIQLDIYNNDVKSLDDTAIFINFIEKHFDIEIYNEFLIDNMVDEYGDYEVDNLLDEKSKNLLIFADKNNVPLVFYYKKNRSIYYLNPTINNNLYNTILERLSIV